MAAPTFNSKSPTIKRILKEASELSAHPDPTLHAAPIESNLFEWHFTLQGPPGTPYSAGSYHGRIVLPPTYPLRPPSFRFLTPSGRFEVNREICLSISGHHEETWQPAWGIRTALCALRAFMEGDAKGQVGGMDLPEQERWRLGEASRLWKCHTCGGRTNESILIEEGGRNGAGETKKTEIPEGLRLGFRDEMIQRDAAKVNGGNEHKISTSKEPERTVASKSGSTAPSDEKNSSSSLANAQASTRSVEHVTSDARISATNDAQVSIQAGVAGAVPTVAPAMGSQRSDRAVNSPVWVDRAITAVAVSLAIMVIKKLLV